MHYHFAWIHAIVSRWRLIMSEEVLAILLVVFIFTMPAAAAMRLQERSLYMVSNEPGATTSYTVSFRYMTPLATIGSIDLLFCEDPIPYHPCVVPAGLNVSGASLTGQNGEMGYSIHSKTINRIVLTRSPAAADTSTVSSYTFSGIKNPTSSNKSFSIRLKTHATTNASGSQIDFGSVKGQVATGITLQTQVPPMLIFCVAGEVSESCTGTNDEYYTDMGNLSHRSTLTARSQMAVGTNASGGFAITANGNPLSAGTNVIDGLARPAESRQGVNQFGINLVANTSPSVGNNPEGEWANAIPSPDYSTPDKYKFVSGDVVAYSPNVSLMKKFTVSYIVNSSENLRAGVYSTTINYIASGRF